MICLIYPYIYKYIHLIFSVCCTFFFLANFCIPVSVAVLWYLSPVIPCTHIWFISVSEHDSFVLISESRAYTLSHPSNPLHSPTFMTLNFLFSTSSHVLSTSHLLILIHNLFLLDFFFPYLAFLCRHIISILSSIAVHYFTVPLPI